MTAPPRAPGASDPGLGFHGFVALMAALMAVNALGIDSMLAALPAIGRAVRAPGENERQWIISIYVIGFGLAQLVYGPLADRYGRKPILVASTLLVAVFAILGGLSNSFPMMLAARAMQGVAAAGARVLVTSIVRDCYSGRQMARVMSLSFIVFLSVPVLAPSIGQLILLVAEWRFIFFFLAAFAGVAGTIGWLRLHETLHPDHRRPLAFAEVGRAIRAVVTERTAIGYTIASALTFGSLVGMIDSIQQIFEDIFRRPAIFPLVFAGIAGSMGVAAFLNSRIVERMGTRRVSHTVLLGFVAVTGVHAAVAASGHETLASFAILQCLTMFCFGMMGANFNSMAMEPVGHYAGTASSVQGFISTCLGAAIGTGIGQLFDGTTLPLALGFFVNGVLALLVVLATERGRLFHGHQASGAMPQPA